MALTTSASLLPALLEALSSSGLPALLSLSRFLSTLNPNDRCLGETTDPDNWVSVPGSLALPHLSGEERRLARSVSGYWTSFLQRRARLWYLHGA